MIADNLLLFLDQPEKLSRVSYQELKTLVMEHPYFAHAHQLLLYKSKLSAHKDYVHDLNRAAAYSVDRSQLRLKLRQLDTEEQVPEELEVLPKGDETVAEPPVTSAPASATAQPTPDPDQTPAVEAIEISENAPEEPQPEQVRWTIPAAASKETAIPQEASAPPLPEPLEKNSFRTWHRRPGITIPFQPSNQLHVGQQPEQHKTPAARDIPSEQPDYNQQAATSVLENTAIISASLADLLAKQGHTEKAVEMYARLSLIFPEKSTYFAAQIEKLKNN
jgi:hypothetical protein